MKNILAIDFGTTMGWAMRVDGVVTSGVVQLGKLGGKWTGGRFLQFKQWLEQMANGMDMVYFEQVRHHLGTQAAHVYGGFLAHLMSFCDEHGIAYDGVGVKTIKLSACGYGNATKQDVIKAMCDLGYNPIDDNEADALALLEHVMKKSGHIVQKP